VCFRCFVFFFFLLYEILLLIECDVFLSFVVLNLNVVLISNVFIAISQVA
jgi:hypothetical protein